MHWKACGGFEEDGKADDAEADEGAEEEEEKLVEKLAKGTAGKKRDAVGSGRPPEPSTECERRINVWRMLSWYSSVGACCVGFRPTIKCDEVRARGREAWLELWLAGSAAWPAWALLWRNEVFPGE